MTTATVAIGNRTMDTADRPRRSPEALVDRLIETLFPAQTETAEPSLTRTIHEARRLRQAGDVDGALGLLAGMDTAKATPRELLWAFSERTGLVNRRFGGRDALLYRQGVGRAALLVPRGDGLLEPVAVLGCAGGPARRSRSAPCGGWSSLPGT